MESKVQDLWSDGRQVFDIAKRAQVQIDRKQAQIDQKYAPGFCVFEYFHVHEIDLSHVFAHLLDPEGSHGQGICFLRLFLVETGWWKNDLPLDSDLTDCKIFEEYSTAKGRRIDIVLKMPDICIGIENKPWAKEQEDQIQDYLEYLDRQCQQKARMCYLSGDGSDPSTILPESQYRCLTVAYRATGNKPSIEHWIEQCMKECEAEQVYWFLESCLKYIRCNFEAEHSPSVCDYEGNVMDNAMVKFVLDRIRNDAENLELACGFEQAMQGVRRHLICEFTEQVENHIDKLITDDWEIHSTRNNPDCDHMVRRNALVVLSRKEWFLKTGSAWPAAGAALNTEEYYWGDVRLCVAAPGDDKTHRPDELGISFREKLPGPEFRSSGYGPTPAFRCLPGELGDWRKPEFLSAVIDTSRSDRMAEQLANDMWELAKALNDMEEFTNIVRQAAQR